jgi:hypothetical protein
LPSPANPAARLKAVGDKIKGKKRVKIIDEGSKTRGIIAVLALMLLACSPAAGAKCACSGGSGGASYNFLGDSAVDINMDSYDEFSRSYAPQSSVRTSVQAPAVETAQESKLSLDLADSSHVDLTLKNVLGEYSGDGTITRVNGTEQAKATGKLMGQKLSLNLVTLSGTSYKFSLAKEGSTVLGDYSEAEPLGENLTGIANGKWIV